MKTTGNLLMMCAAMFLFACGSKNSDPTPAPTGTNMPQQGKITKIIIINSLTITYSGGVPNVFELRNNIGTDIVLTSSPNGTPISLVNEYGGAIISPVITSNGETFTYANILQQTDDHRTDTLAQRENYYVYASIPVDKSIGYDEIHAFLGKDGTQDAGQLRLIGNPTYVSTADIYDIFKNAKVILSKIEIN